MNFNFPRPPEFKIKLNDLGLTLEQAAIFKMIEREDLTAEEEEGMKQVIEFYKEAFAYLRKIPLSNTSESDARAIRLYLNEIIELQVIIENDIDFPFLYRVTPAKEDFLSGSKVRDVQYLTFPSAKVLKGFGSYNRASSPELPVFYAAFHQTVALFETKPRVGDRIIITTWANVTRKKFISFPISNNESVKNGMLEQSTKAFRELRNRVNPLLFAVFDQYMLFLSSEFVKNERVLNPKRHEYLFSSYFGDQLLKREKVTWDKVKPKNDKGKNMGKFDCILYPSVAFNHQAENIAVATQSVTENLRPFKIIDCMVEEELYSQVVNVTQSPVKLKVLRYAVNVNGTKISWNDD